MIGIVSIDNALLKLSCNAFFSVHVWDYRRLIINKIGITLTDELLFSTERLNANFSNYSSWHYRSTLRNLDEESAGTELTLVQNAVFTDPADSSAWFYLRWVLSNPTVNKDRRQELLDALEQLEELEPDCKCKNKVSQSNHLSNMYFRGNNGQMLAERQPSS